MVAAPLPHDEYNRIANLRRFEILDTAAEEAFDRYTRIAAKILNVPISLISLVDDVRQWFKSHHGLDARETPRDWAFCAYAILAPDQLVVPDAAEDPRFSDNPLVTGEPGIRFYVSVHSPVSLVQRSASALNPNGFPACQTAEVLIRWGHEVEGTA